MTEMKQSKEDILQLLVEEVDEARETHELVMQLKEALPIRSFHDIITACSKNEGDIIFRGKPFDVSLFEEVIPSIIFPIEDIRTLIELVYIVVIRLAPKYITYNLEIPENAKRHVRRSQMKMLIPSGAIGPVSVQMPEAGLPGRLGPKEELPKKEEG